MLSLRREEEEMVPPRDEGMPRERKRWTLAVGEAPLQFRRELGYA